MPKVGETGQLRRLMFNGHRASVWENEKFWRSRKMMSARTGADSPPGGAPPHPIPAFTGFSPNRGLN